MTVVHDTFTIARTYPTALPRAYAAFATRAAKTAWFASGADPDNEFDFRVGGHERFAATFHDTRFRYDAVYYDIVANRRIIYGYEMYAVDDRISVSVATIEFEATADGTEVRWTEQGAYLDGFDTPDMRRGGTAEELDRLTAYLAH
jgi:uncharacterized protein YndB with AHSA1/START domain